ncbi:MAG: MBL fold metallo-hydrolase [Planctomycetes bacterium]|nr:MBL fold metallo-hydrolase [Planctomycetota bacterium]
MRVTVLGSGTGIPAPDRCPTGFRVDVSGACWLLDLGSGTLRRLAESGGRPNDVTRILLTHLHPDHTADLVPFLFASRHGEGGRTAPLELVGPTGTDAWIHELLAAYGRWVAPRFPFSVRESLDGEFLLGGVRVTVRQMAHEAWSVGYRLESGGGALAFSGDTGEHAGVVELARGAAVFFAECSFPEGGGTATHLTPGSLARIAAAAGPGRVVITHVYPPVDPEAQAAAVRARWGGEVTAARDLEVFEVHPAGPVRP